MLRRPAETAGDDELRWNVQTDPVGCGECCVRFFLERMLMFFLARDCMFDRLIIETGCWETHVAN